MNNPNQETTSVTICQISNPNQARNDGSIVKTLCFILRRGFTTLQAQRHVFAGASVQIGLQSASDTRRFQLIPFKMVL